jgi:hypothetical protein
MYPVQSKAKIENIIEILAGKPMSLEEFAINKPGMPADCTFHYTDNVDDGTVNYSPVCGVCICQRAMRVLLDETS